MADLTLKPAGATAAPKRRTPSKKDLAPWDFAYAPSPDGQDRNLMIMFHGLGDTKAAFAGLGAKLNLPGTAVLSLQAPFPIPLLEAPAFMWFNAFDPMFNPLPNPDPTPALPNLRKLLISLCGLGWAMTDIHLFGWQQGATMALELAWSVAEDPLGIPSEGSDALEVARRLGSVVAVCGNMVSWPSPTSTAGQTPALWFTRSDPRAQVNRHAEAGLRRAFATLEVVRGEGHGLDMPRSQAEWKGIMKFWGQVLGRQEGWRGDGEVYEVVQS